MEYRQLGGSGLRVSKLCLGTMIGFTEENFEEAARIIDEAVDSGINFVDTADCYGEGESERTVGRALAEGGKRHKVVLATKFGWYMGEGANDYGASREHIIRACEESLRRLRTDYIDLYIVHVVDPNTPMEETLYALDVLVRQGKVRYVGTSKHPSFMILEGIFISERYGWARFVSEQPPYNILDRTAENELIPMCMRYGVGIVPYSPIASGLLSGKYRLGREVPEGRFSKAKLDGSKVFTTRALEAVEKLVPLAEERGITLAEFSLAWVMQQPGVTSAVLGARKLEYLRSGLRACEIELTEEELEAVDEIVPPGSFVSNFYESSVYRPLRGGYSREVRGAGAFIPYNRGGSHVRGGWTGKGSG